jgi:hypothetical protein
MGSSLVITWPSFVEATPVHRSNYRDYCHRNRNGANGQPGGPRIYYEHAYRDH